MRQLKVYGGKREEKDITFIRLANKQTNKCYAILCNSVMMVWDTCIPHISCRLWNMVTFSVLCALYIIGNAIFVWQLLLFYYYLQLQVSKPFLPRIYTVPTTTRMTKVSPSARMSGMGETTMRTWERFKQTTQPSCVRKIPEDALHSGIVDLAMMMRSSFLNKVSFFFSACVCFVSFWLLRKGNSDQIKGQM